MKKAIYINTNRAIIYSCENNSPCPILYMHINEEKEADTIWQQTKENDYILICLQGIDWNKDMSPWPAPKVFKGGEDFAGKADGYIDFLTNTIIPQIENTIDHDITKRGLAGYSLSGLFALYSLFKTDLFTMIGSMSGSLWYNDFIDFMQSNNIKIDNPKVYLSLGDKESKTKNPQMASVETCTQKAQEILDSYGAKTILEMNPGNHFTDIENRIIKGITWLLNQ